MQKLFFKAGGLIDDVHIFTKGKSINAEKDENVELTRSQVFLTPLKPKNKNDALTGAR